MVNARRSKDLISSLMNDRGEEVKGTNEIEDEILSFFSALYGPSIEAKPFVEGVDWCPISDKDRRIMDFPFSVEEIRRLFSSVIGTNPSI